MNENLYFLNIRGKVNIPMPITIGHNYRLIADCSVVSENKSDNEDGTFSITYKLVPLTAEIGKDNGPTLKAKDPRRNSEKFRKYLYKLWMEHEANIYDFQEVYDAVVLEAMSDFPEYLYKAVKKLESK